MFHDAVLASLTPADNASPFALNHASIAVAASHRTCVLANQDGLVIHVKILVQKTGMACSAYKNAPVRTELHVRQLMEYASAHPVLAEQTARVHAVRVTMARTARHPASA